MPPSVEERVAVLEAQHEDLCKTVCDKFNLLHGDIVGMRKDILELTKQSSRANEGITTSMKWLPIIISVVAVGVAAAAVVFR